MALVIEFVDLDRHYINLLMKDSESFGLMLQNVTFNIENNVSSEPLVGTLTYTELQIVKT